MEVKWTVPLLKSVVMLTCRVVCQKCFVKVHRRQIVCRPRGPFTSSHPWLEKSQLLPCQSFTDCDQFVFDLSTVFRQYALTKAVRRPSWLFPLVRTRSLNKCKLSVGDAGLSLRRTRGLHKSVATLPISYWSCLNFASLRTVKWAGQAGLSLSPYPWLE